MRYVSVVLVLVGLAMLAVPGCSSGPDGTLVIYTTDQNLAQLILGLLDIVRTENGAVITVTGDATIDGTIEATDGLLKLVVLGNLTINGILRSVHSNPPNTSGGASFRNQGFGICIVLAGNLTMGDNASLRSNGPVVITDSDPQLDRLLDEVYDEADSASGTLPTLVPLDPADPVFSPAIAGHGPSLTQQLPFRRIAGRWDLSGLPGNKPVLLFRFNDARDLHLDGWTFIPPGGTPGAGANPNPGQNANGASGGNGLNLNIWNNNGAIRIINTVTLNLADGGPGGGAQATCATATGGKGGKSGNLRITASQGIDIAGGTLVIVPGRSGDGGDATVLKGNPGADGCPGAKGDDSTANGGDGGDNKKRVLVRGNVQGIGNIQYGSVVAGNGGNADAVACDGGNGLPCCDGGDGGKATSTGGNGGDASLHLGGFGITHTGIVAGGDGGDAIAVGGNGGDGGKCAFGKGGDGGDGGAAEARLGDGGDATAAGGAGLPFGGDSGQLVGNSAEATGGNGGNGGDTVFGTVGLKGVKGSPLVAAAGLAGTPGGLLGAVATIDGVDGADGMVIPPVVFCIPMAPLVPLGPVIPLGPILGHPLEDPPGTVVGSIDLNLNGDENTVVRAEPDPDHLMIDGGEIEIDLQSMSLTGAPVPPPITGIEIVPLDGPNIDQANPMQVELVGPQGEILRTIQVGQIPDNTQIITGLPVPIPIDFGQLPELVAVVRIRVPLFAPVRFLKITLIDP